MAGASTTYGSNVVRGTCDYASPATAATRHSSSSESYSYLPEGPGRKVLATTTFHLRLLDSDGYCKWDDRFSNTVVTAGLNKLLDATFKTGYSSPAWYVGLVDGVTTPVIAAGDTLTSHAGWSENSGYSESTRQALTLGAITNGTVDNDASQAIFHINADGAVAGCFIATASTGTSGTLYDVGVFIDGTRVVRSGDILHVISTLSISAS